MSAPAETVKREKARRTLEDLAAMAPLSLEAHAKLFHRTDKGRRIVAARHHRAWAEILEDRESFPYVCIVAGPGTAKTSWCGEFYTSWRIGQEHGRIRMGLISNTATQAENVGRAVQRTIEEELYGRVYGVRPDVRRGWASNRMFVTGTPEGLNPTLTCTGIGGPIQGRRFDEIVLDDPSDWDDARSLAIMEAQRSWLKGMLIQRFPIGQRPPDGRGTRMVVILTRWSAQDLVPTLEELGFRIILMQSLGYWDRKVYCPDCERERDPDPYALLQRCENCDSSEEPRVELGDEPLWPEAESREMLLREREDDPILFELLKQGNVKVLGGDTFDPDNFQRGELPAPENFVTVVQCIDTASGKDMASGNYFAEVTLGHMADGRGWVIDVDRNRYDAPTQQSQVPLNYERWSNWRGGPLDAIGIENVNEGAALYQTLVRSTRLPLRPLEPDNDKVWRAIPLANAYRGRLIWHPERARWRRPYEAELEAFPGAFTDQVDAAAYAWREVVEEGPQIRVLR